MKIRLQKLKLSPALSQDTTAYTAIILVDGCLALHASNHGRGLAHGAATLALGSSK